MADGLKTTFEVLTSTRNEAAVGVLLPALDSQYRGIQEGVLRALLGRRSPSGHRELVRRWDRLNDRWKRLIAENGGRMSDAVRDAVLSADRRQCVNGCNAAVRIREYDLIPTLMKAAEDQANPNGDVAAATMVQLAELLYGELASPRDYRERRDPQLMRQYVVGSLETSVASFDQHGRTEVLEAFLLLAERENTTLRRILQDPRHGAYLAIVDALLRSPRPGVMRLSINYLDGPRPPSVALSTLARRCDPPFLRRLLKNIGCEPSDQVKHNVKRVDAIRWGADQRNVLLELDDAEQFAAVQLLMASGMKRLELFEVVRFLIEYGNEGGRRAASIALAEFSGSDANRLILGCLKDKDPQVQANALRHIRKRGIPGAMRLLIERLDSPFPPVRQAAQECLGEFNLQRYLAAFDMLDDSVRVSTGLLVKKVDSEIVEGLLEELASRSRTRRLRALRAAAAMRSVEETADRIIELLADEDHFVRAEAARALRHCGAKESRQALREALMDRSVAVQEAAEESLRAVSQRAAATPTDAASTMNFLDNDSSIERVESAPEEGAT